jgi:hypothetical protein
VVLLLLWVWSRSTGGSATWAIVWEAYCVGGLLCRSTGCADTWGMMLEHWCG